MKTQNSIAQQFNIPTHIIEQAIENLGSKITPIKAGKTVYIASHDMDTLNQELREISQAEAV